MTAALTSDAAAGGAGPTSRVAVIGPHILDVLGRPVEAIPPGQGSVRLTEIRATAAGTAAGTGVDLAKLGARVSSFGAVGTDLLAEVLLAALASYGIDTRGLVRKSSAQTSATILPIRPNGERPALHVPGATRLLELSDLDHAELAGGFDAVLLGGPDALAGLSRDDLGAVVAAAREGGALVAVDVLHAGSERDFDRIGAVLAGADWFWPNSDQLLALTGRTDLEHAVGDVLALGTRGVAVTLGADGCVVTGPDGLTHVPAIAVDVVDTTGCGDAFNAGMLTALLMGCDPADSAWLGVACGSLVATGLGSDAGLTDLDQVLDFLRAASPEVSSRISARRAPSSTASISPAAISTGERVP
ncbi:MAG TPA: PfkB family carbohydrate kinase [Streptosporangiaceae bacterium]|nr:PfkB family carbohydrate kinase [Streptosporangiaceae bacterium]